MNSLTKKVVGVAALLILIAAFLVLSMFVNTGAPAGMREIKTYRPGAVCQAISPDCGICPGEVKNYKCYVKQDTYEMYR